MKSSPAFQFYPGDYLRSQRVQLLSLEEEGAYIRLISYCWLHGSIPADPDALVRLIGKGGSRVVAETVAKMFQLGPTSDTLIHDRLEAERSKQEVWRSKSAEGGRKSAETRALRAKNRKGGTKGGSTTVPTKDQPPAQPNGNIAVSSLQSSSPNRSEEVTAHDIYACYPRKVAARDALEAITKAMTRCAPAILIERTKAYHEACMLWPTPERHFIPYPATWFNRDSYNDDPTTWQRTETSGKPSGNGRQFSQRNDYSKIGNHNC